eukprot:TRINITY_DN13615_c0_g1_i1.p1 TRINITY_DN13615_c0_g1~~TRINITY_DN13615_c0_g1_i1.p1  ORF type:complete len:240 (-),score=48.00 TRINITY_DN13615_c0_g1_i1:220-894(-)
MDVVQDLIQDLTISKLLSFGIIFGALILKVPQIQKILKNGSVEGLSSSMFILEALAFTNSIAYSFALGYDFYTYGESTFILVQLYMINFLIFYYRNLLLNFYIVIGSFFYFVYFVCTLMGVVPIEVLTLAMNLNLVLTIVSKLPQIYDNFVRRSAGQLSVISLFLQFAGSCARTYTTLQDVQDNIVLSGYLASAFLGFILIVQCLIYPSGEVTKPETSDEKKKE